MIYFKRARIRQNICLVAFTIMIRTMLTTSFLHFCLHLKYDTKFMDIYKCLIGIYQREHSLVKSNILHNFCSKYLIIEFHRYLFI